MVMGKQDKTKLLHRVKKSMAREAFTTSILGFIQSSVLLSRDNDTCPVHLTESRNQMKSHG